MGRLLLIFLSFKVGRLLAREGGNCEEVVSSPEKIILHLVHTKLIELVIRYEVTAHFHVFYNVHCTYMYGEIFKEIQVYLTCGKAMWSTVVEKSENLWKMNLVRAGKKPKTQQ